MNCNKVMITNDNHYSYSPIRVEFRATSRVKLLCLGPQVVALIISLPAHFSSWNLMIKLKVM